MGAGGLFAGIVERHGAIELSENRRQPDAEERRALEAIRNGLGRDYLAFAEGAGRLVACETPVAAKTRLLADWWAAARSDLPANVMIALRRRDVSELNALGRTLMETHGRLGSERLTIGGASSLPATASSASATPRRSGSRTARAEQSSEPTGTKRRCSS